MMEEVRRGLGDILEEVRGQKEQIIALARMVQELLDRHHLADREVRPQDSFTIQAQAEHHQVKQLVEAYRGLPKDQQARLPALLNGLGKLEHAAGDFPAAQAIFAEVAACNTLMSRGTRMAAPVGCGDRFGPLATSRAFEPAARDRLPERSQPLECGPGQVQRLM